MENSKFMKQNKQDDMQQIIDNIEDKKDCVLALSFLTNKLCKSKYFIMLVDYITKNKNSFSLETQFFLYQQILLLKFKYDYASSDDYQQKIDLLLYDILENYRKKFQQYDHQISKNQIRKDFIIVVTDQFLGRGHAPTSLAMQWCDELVKNGKKVLLINTAENCTPIGIIPFGEGVGIGNYISEYTECDTMNVGSRRVPFFQCDQIMPNDNVLEMLLSLVEKERPEMIISLGDIIFSDLANRMVPVYTVALGYAMPRTFTKYRMLIGKKKYESDNLFLEHFGFSANSVIETDFTFSIPEQNEIHTREEFNISDSTFCLMIIGNRLESDLTVEFLEALNELLKDQRLFALFVGDFDFESIVSSYENLPGRSKHIKYTSDLLSVIELGDLYINPKRLGGGTSAIYALKKGKPVITVDYGDVAFNVGEEFCVQDYAEMQKQVIRYLEDSPFYKKMSEQAIKKAKQLTEQDMALYKQVVEIERREDLNHLASL